MIEWLKETYEITRDHFGCPESKIKKHRFEWGVGPTWNPLNWWVYCTRCDYKFNDRYAG